MTKEKKFSQFSNEQFSKAYSCMLHKKDNVKRKARDCYMDVNVLFFRQRLFKTVSRLTNSGILIEKKEFHVVRFVSSKPHNQRC